MEINRFDIEKPQQRAWSTSDGQVLDSHVRSYRCTFCKRGFSNAQALGGHNNIHRKDRARLNGSFEETLFSMDHDLTKKNPSTPTASSNDDLLQLDTSRDHDIHQKSCAHKRPWIFSEEDEENPRRKYCYKELLQLPFFVEKSYTSNDFGTSSNFGDGHVEKKHGSSSLELDLELRLGPEPQDSLCVNKR